MTAPEPETTTVRVTAGIKAELEKIQREFREDHPGGNITINGVITQLLIIRAGWLQEARGRT